MITSDSRALTERKAVVWVVRALSYLVYFYLIVVEIVLFIGFFLLLFGANPSAGFTQWAYRNLDRVMAPFRGIFTPIELGTTSADVQATFDTSVLFAMIIYGIVALVLNAFIGWLSGGSTRFTPPRTEIEREAEVAAQQAAAEQAAVAPASAPDVSPRRRHRPEIAATPPPPRPERQLAVGR